MNAAYLVDFVDQSERRLRKSSETHKVHNSRQRTLLEMAVTECSGKSELCHLLHQTAADLSSVAAPHYCGT